MRRVINIGCGGNGAGDLPLEFFGDDWSEIRVDTDPEVHPDIIASMTALPPDWDGMADGVWCSHSLEHVYAHEVPVALAEFLRVLRPGGLLAVTVPDLLLPCLYVVQGQPNATIYESAAGPIAALDMLFGHRGYVAAGQTGMAHRTGFTVQTLQAALVAAGYERVTVARDGAALWATAYRPEATTQP